MRVAARLYASEAMVEHLVQERALDQLVNTATLPGVQEPALAMPDIHQGYGFPIGGVVATRAADGVISPGGVGYDINCGVRLLAGSARFPEVREHLAGLATQIQRDVPTGGSRSTTAQWMTSSTPACAGRSRRDTRARPMPNRSKNAALWR